MKTITRLLGIAALLGLMLPGIASAVGTGAGTVISNTATATYGIGTLTGLTATSPTVTVTVQQVTDVVVTAINSPITVNPGDTGAAAAFTITNTGNGTDNFTLLPNSTLPGDQFDPVLAATSLALDVNNDGIYTPGTDTAIAGPITLAADAYTQILVINDIPGGVADTYTGLTQVAATSNTASGAPGTVVPGGGVGGVNAIVGGNGGSTTVQATYTVSSVVVNVSKTSTVTADPYGSVPPQAIPGATIRYTLTVTVTGGGTANGIVITDPIPANTTYVPGTITLNAAPVADATAFTAPPAGANAAGLVTVNLGNIAGTVPPAIPPTQTITFDVTIN